MSRQVTVLGALLALSLTGSYLRWTGDKDADAADGVVILDATPEQIATVTWDSDTLDLVLTMREDALGRYAMVRVTEQKQEPVPTSEPPDPGALAAPEPPEPGDAPDEGGDDDADDAAEDADEDDDADDAPPVETRTVEELTEFKAGKAGDDLIALLAPMKARRALDGVAADRLGELGLDDPEATLTIEREGKEPRTFELGGEAYGTRDRYLREVGSGRIYLIEDKLIRPLQYGKTRLPDRELLGVDAAALRTLTITADGQTARFQQQNADDPKAAFWATEGGEKDEAAGNWVDKLLKLSSASFVQADEVPTGERVVLSVQVESKSGPPVTLELLQGTDPEGKEAWYARSSYTRVLVKLHASQASDLASDVETILPEG